MSNTSIVGLRNVLFTGRLIDIGMHAHWRAVDQDLELSPVPRLPIHRLAIECFRQSIGSASRPCGDRHLRPRERKP